MLQKQTKLNRTGWEMVGGLHSSPQPWSTVTTPLQRQGQSGLGLRRDCPPRRPAHCAWRSCVMVWPLGCSPPTPPLASESSELGISQLQTQEMWVHSLGREDSPEEGMTTCSSTLAGKSHGQRHQVGCRGGVICVYSCSPSTVSSLLTG